VLVLFIIASDIAVIATILAIVARVTLHALLYLAVSLIAVAVAFYTLGAPFVAALEVIIYAGAIVVLFVFAVMLIAPEVHAGAGMRSRWSRLSWLGIGVLVLVLLGELVVVVAWGPSAPAGGETVGPTAVAVSLFGPYALAVELASMLLLVALIGARHLAGRRETAEELAEAGEQAGEQPAGEVLDT
jgi:NADH-quinone oxidoreductase subunit J